MEPITEQHRAYINVVRYILGAVDDHRTKETSSILRTVVRVIPGGTVEVGFKRIGKRTAWGYRTLLHCRNAIEPWSLTLQNTVPVKGGAFLGTSNGIVDGDLKGISPISLQGRGRECTVDQ